MIRRELILLLVFFPLGFSAGALEKPRPEKLAADLRIKSVQFQEATAGECMDFLRRTVASKVYPVPFKMVYLGDVNGDKFDFAWNDIPVLEVLQLMAVEADLRLGASDEAIYLYREEDPGVALVHLREIPWSTPAIRFAASRAAAQRATYADARRRLLKEYGGKERVEEVPVPRPPAEVIQAIHAFEESERGCNDRLRKWMKLLLDRDRERAATPRMNPLLKQ